MDPLVASSRVEVPPGLDGVVRRDKFTVDIGGDAVELRVPASVDSDTKPRLLTVSAFTNDDPAAGLSGIKLYMVEHAETLQFSVAQFGISFDAAMEPVAPDRDTTVTFVQLGNRNVFMGDDPNNVLYKHSFIVPVGQLYKPGSRFSLDALAAGTFHAFKEMAKKWL